MFWLRGAVQGFDNKIRIKMIGTNYPTLMNSSFFAIDIDVKGVVLVQEVDLIGQ